MMGGGFDFIPYKNGLDMKNTYSHGNNSNPYRNDTSGGTGYMMNIASHPFLPMNQQAMSLYNTLGATTTQMMHHHPSILNPSNSQFTASSNLDAFFFDQNNNNNDNMNNFQFGAPGFGQPEFTSKDNFKVNF